MENKEPIDSNSKRFFRNKNLVVTPEMPLSEVFKKEERGIFPYARQTFMLDAKPTDPEYIFPMYFEARVSTVQKSGNRLLHMGGEVVIYADQYFNIEDLLHILNKDETVRLTDGGFQLEDKSRSKHESDLVRAIRENSINKTIVAKLKAANDYCLRVNLPYLPGYSSGDFDQRRRHLLVTNTQIKMMPEMNVDNDLDEFLGGLGSYYNIQEWKDESIYTIFATDLELANKQPLLSNPVWSSVAPYLPGERAAEDFDVIYPASVDIMRSIYTELCLQKGYSKEQIIEESWAYRSK